MTAPRRTVRSVLEVQYCLGREGGQQTSGVRREKTEGLQCRARSQVRSHSPEGVNSFQAVCGGTRLAPSSPSRQLARVSTRKTFLGGPDGPDGRERPVSRASCALPRLLVAFRPATSPPRQPVGPVVLGANRERGAVCAAHERPPHTLLTKTPRRRDRLSCARGEEGAATTEPRAGARSGHAAFLSVATRSGCFQPAYSLNSPTHKHARTLRET